MTNSIKRSTSVDVTGLGANNRASSVCLILFILLVLFVFIVVLLGDRSNLRSVLNCRNVALLLVGSLTNGPLLRSAMLLWHQMVLLLMAVLLLMMSLLMLQKLMVKFVLKVRMSVLVSGMSLLGLVVSVLLGLLFVSLAARGKRLHEALA